MSKLIKCLAAVTCVALLPGVIIAQNSMQFTVTNTVTGGTVFARGIAQDPPAANDNQVAFDTGGNPGAISLVATVNCMSEDGLPDFTSLASMIATHQAEIIPAALVPQCNSVSSVIGGGTSSLDGNFFANGTANGGCNMNVVVGPEGGNVTALVSIIVSGGDNVSGSATVTVDGNVVVAGNPGQGGVFTLDLGYRAPNSVIPVAIQTNVATATAFPFPQVGIGGTNGESDSAAGFFSAVAAISGITADPPGGGTGGGGTGGGPGGGN